MHKKNPAFSVMMGATGVLTILCAPAGAEPVAASETVVASTVVASEPILSSAPASAPSSIVAMALPSRLGMVVQPYESRALATDPLAASKLAATAPLMAAKSAAAKPAPTKSDVDGLSAAEKKLLAELDAELRTTESRLKKANAQLSAGQQHLTRVASLLESEMMQGGPDSRGLHPFVRVAQRYAGTPYVWGGESARGFDCSGFIIRVMRDLGYKALPHSAAEQFRYGIPVAKQNLRPGDLVFFANTYKPGISHVGIYLGRGRFIHAAGTGLGTIVSPLHSGTYAAKYAGARRLVRVKS